LDWNFIPIE